MLEQHNSLSDLSITFSKLDELSLYLEISKYKTRIHDLKQEYMNMPNAENREIQFQSEIPKLKKMIQLCQKELKKFGINPKSKHEVCEWMTSCQMYLNNLDMVEYAIFLQTRASGQLLDKFCSYVKEGYSSFMEKSENHESEKIKAMKIS